MKNFVSSLLISLLFSSAYGQTITVVNPNGGETLYACQSYTISWTTSGTLSNYYDISYSLDGGTIWASITTNYLSTNGQYVWTVPNVQSSTCLIRVRDAQNGTIVDQSNANFTINIPITVLTPNGGESIQGGDTYTITWNGIGTSGSYNLYYSTNGGSTWTTIITNYATASGIYNWTVPNIPSTNCLIRVRDYVTSCMQDESNAAFTIVADQPVLTSPNGAENWYPNCSYNITWNTATFYSTVNLEYSVNNGTTWTTIVTGTANDGSQTWTVPLSVSSTCLVRASNSANTAVNDVSDATFSILTPITVTAPNGGETFYGCSTYPISWTKPNACISQFAVSYSIDNGATWTLISNPTNSGSGTTQSVNWTVPNSITTVQALIKVADYYNAATIFDVSNLNFTILPSNDITVTAPNGGEILNALTTSTITWTNLPTASGAYNVQYSTNGGSSYTTIASNITGNAYIWSVPNIPSTTCLIKVIDAVNTCKFDVSNANFTIQAAAPILLSPNGGEQFNGGCSYNITWDATTFYTTVRLDYSSDNGVTWNPIITSTANDGIHPWTVPTTYSSTYLVKIANTSDLLTTDISAAPFTVQNPITVTAMNGGETVIGCSTYTITWNKPGSCISQFSVYVSIDNGATWGLIASPVNSGSGTTQSQSWTAPNGISSTTALIKVVDYYNSTTIFDVSNANFTIAPSNDVTVTAPNGGESFSALTTTTITWTNLPAASGQYNLQYSTNGGASYTTIASGLTGNAYSWTVPNIPSTNCLIKVIDAVNTCKFDVSNAVFTILPPLPVLLTPNGGEVLNAGCSYNITWDASVFYSTVRLDYSTDGGTTWTNIITSTTNDGTHPWTPPYTYGTNYVVKIANTSDLLTTDISATPFTVQNPITVTAMNGGETVNGCSTYSITWNKPGSCISQFAVYYSIDNGTTWTLIASPVNSGAGTTQSQSWTVPNGISSSTALIKVVDYYNSTVVYDVSNANFTIAPSNDITVTAPNGGESFSALTTTTITWTNLPSASGQYNLQYSTNGGSSYTTIASGLTGNAYTWTVPNIPSTNCLIKVIDAVNTCKFDVSNAVFTILPPLPVLLTPNGGEVLNAGCSYNITWDASVFYSTVRLDYSTNGGSTWTTIITSTANDGTHPWTPPYTYGTNYVVKIANTSDLLTTDISAAPFTVQNPITVTAMNGGETVNGCSTYSITWNKPGSCISQFSVYYSIDNGTTWTLIASPVNSGAGTTQSQSWTVPNGISSSTALIKVVDYYNSTVVYDVSNANFTIAPSNDITVTAPNGGQSFSALSTTTITWTNLPSASGQYNLQYSTNGGSSYTTIASGLTGNAYTWTVPNIPSTNCLIKVIDAVNTCKFDVSNAVFTILPPSPILLTPNGGEVLNAGCSYNITWDASVFYSTVRLDYSTDGGSTWTNIITSTANDGTHPWTPPYTYGTNYMVKIANTTDLLTTDISAGPFTVQNPITVTAMNGGETVNGCSTYSVTWNKPGSCISQFSVYYSIDNGTTWALIASPVNSGSGTTQSQSWTVPNGISSTTALIKVVDYYNSTVAYDVSNANFTIAPSNDVTVTAPNGGETFQGLSTTTITWSNLPSASGQYNLQYSTNGGSSYTTIASNVIGNAYTWTVPNIPSTTCLIKVIDAVNTCKFDVSNANFEITPATPIVLTPNGGESMYAATSYNITWNAASYYSNVRIDYSIDNGFTWNLIVSNSANDGTHTWTVPNTASTQCLVKVSNMSNLSVNDVSNSVFTIKAAVTILTPNGDNGITSWGGCTVTSITFDHTPAYTSWNVLYSLNGGTTWSTIASNWTQTANPATYNWNIPNTSSSNVLVKVEPYLNTPYSDQSDAPFTVDKPVTIIQPNFGGIMQVGSVYNITWNSDGISNIYDIFFSDNGGTTWSTVVLGYNTSTNSYAWTVPNAPSTNCKIRVRDNINNCKEDTSDVAFTISTVAPALTVLTPNGGETLNACANYNITWAEASPNGAYDISYSSNSGSSWTPIVSNYLTGTMSYNWTVPNITSGTILVKVKAYGTAIEDLSNALLSIAGSNLVVSSADTTVCSGSPVQLNASGALGYSWSPTTGLSNPLISNPIASPSVTTTYVVSYTNGSCTLQDQVTINVNTIGAVPVSAAITASPSTTICSGDLVSFTATPTNGGTSPSYQWTVNGLNVGTNAASYSSSTLSNNDVVAVILTTSETCVTNNPASSNALTMSVSANATPSVSVAASATTICSGSTASFTATPVNGGSSPSYQWKVNGVNAGTNSANYSSSTLANGDVVTVTMSSSSACALGGPVTSSGVTMTVTNVPSQPILTSGNTSVCSGTTQTYSIAAVAGASTYNWTLPSGWSGSSTGPSITVTTGTTGGLISVEAINNCGSSSALSVPVTVYGTTTISANASATTICSGTAVTLAGTGGISYTWTGGVTNGIAFSPTATASYTVVGTDINGCTDTDLITITVNALPTVSANASVSALCTGESVTLTGGGANTYSWNNGVTNNVSFTPSSTATYTVSGTATNGCSNTAQVSVTVNALPTVNAGTDQTVCAATPVTLTGSGASTYTWNNGVSNGIAFAPSTTQTYTVTGTSSNGCINTDQVIVTVNSAPTVVATTSTMTACIGSSITLSGSGASSYTWNNGVSNGIAFTPSSTQTYTVTGTSVNGCTDTDQITISVNTLPTVTANASATAICAGSSVTLSGGGANNYSWNNGVSNGVSFTPSSTATHTVTGTNSNGCMNTAQVTVVVNANPVVNAGTDQVVCQNANVVLSASGASTYSWNNGITNNVAFPAVSTTTYTVTGTDVNGCTATDQVTVTINASPTVIASSVPTVICQGASIVLTGSGASTYTWNNGVTNGVAFTPSSTQTYTVTGTDAIGCTDTDQITVTVNPLPSVTANASSTSVCAGTTVNLTGGGAVNYSWNNGVLNGIGFVPTATQTYTVTGTSATGCTNTAQVSIAVQSAPSVIAGGGGTICAGTSIGLTASGASVYNWNNGAGSGSSITVSPTTSTIYTVTGTSLNGCIASDQVLVTVNSAPSLLTSGNTAICSGSSATLTVNGAQTYSWNNGAGSGSSVTVSPTNTTTYTVTGTNAGGCTSTAQVTVTVNSLPVISASGTSPICEGEATVLTASGGATYLWDNGAGSGASVSVSPISTTTYTVTGTDANGCVSTDQINVSVNAAPIPTVTMNGGTLQTGTYASYQWYVNSTAIPGATGSTWNYTENGDYYVEVTNGNGCSGVSSTTSVMDASLAEATTSKFSLYPNPTLNEIYVDFGKEVNNITIHLMNSLGQLIYSEDKVSGTLFMHSMQDMATGIYYLEIQEGESISTMRFVKE